MEALLACSGSISGALLLKITDSAIILKGHDIISTCVVYDNVFLPSPESFVLKSYLNIRNVFEDVVYLSFYSTY